MATSDKEQQSELVPQHKRMAAGSWVNGEQMKEQGSATMPKANSDHGNFGNGKGIDKKNS